ncbi:hypothetical protein ETB97_011674 [Aspergillus alliaceus]|uniref:Uncharacterized protein n=1 Tax=Petromyces alliaceus TaxID=209559 RepID=A0A8H6A9T2_PETAA|nr:hypothetical protein ETB97_011674 [Aspergillus burnettii]
MPPEKRCLIRALPKRRSNSDQVEVDGQAASSGVTLQEMFSDRLKLDEVVFREIEATFVGIWRLIWHLVILSKGFFSAFLLKDPTYDIGFCSSTVEVHVAVMAACPPAMKAIATKYLPRLLGTSHQEETSRYSTASASNWFRSGYGSSRPKTAVRSKTDDGFELAEPYQAKIDPIAGEREMRK